ncbi:hypothetical protein D8674_028925 [Pyrus ussuriensis x Pyrus communis]|uniref:Uncharacterized protein n=1 Tax=Pyrus ussuriensis x Pyrus communis TaxID=2448454 RepID=A0A5N5HYL3_9ROSA|nr:hypothetical protein D8674_028925 [Pyrus ussuriensis x Pyrus communis]
MVQANTQYQQTTSQSLQALQQGQQAFQQKQVGQLAAIVSARDQDIFPSEPEVNPIEHSMNKGIDHELSELAEGEEKIENSKLEDPLNESLSQRAITNWSLYADIQVVDEVSNIKVLDANPSPLDIPECHILNATDSKVPNSFILHEFKDLLNPMTKIWWKRQRKKMKNRKKSKALKLKNQKYAVPHCLVSTPNFKATRWKKGKKKKMHGVVPHFNYPPSFP